MSDRLPFRVTAKIYTRIDRHGDRVITTKAREWLKQNIRGSWGVHYRNDPATFYFECESDAAFFEAQWRPL